MAIATEVVARAYLNISAGTAIPVDFPLFAVDEVKVIYGQGVLTAVQNTDYTVTLGDPFDTFTVTPLAPLLTKINALIAADPTNETNRIVVRRELDYLTSVTPALARQTQFMSAEVDRAVMREIQLDDALARTIRLSENFAGSYPQIDVRNVPTGSELAGSPAMVWQESGGLGFGAKTADIDAAATNAAVATAAAASAAASAAAIEPYANRAAAIAAEVPSAVGRIFVLTPHGVVLSYVTATAVDRRLALTTNAGARYWVPGDWFVSPQHYGENTTPGTTDLIAALDAMTAGLAHTPLVGVTYSDFTALYFGGRSDAPKTVSFLGERVAISRPWLLGALDVDLDGDFDVGPGAIYGVHLTNGRLDVLDTFDATDLATHTHPSEGTVTTVPGYAMVLGTYELTDRQTAQSNLFYVDGITVASTFEFNCNFTSGGIFIINTNRTTIEAAHIFNMAKGTMGIRTSVSDKILTPNHIGNFNPQVGAPFPVGGAQTKNPELRINKTSVSGRNRQAGVTFPVGETDLTMVTTAIGIYTADFHLIDPLITATTVSGELDMFHNGQFIGGHPWANSFIWGPDCANVQTLGGYWDTTDIVLYSFKHSFVGCNWGAGNKNLRLVATTANEDADGLVVTGGRFYNTSTIAYATEASGSWVDPTARKHVLMAYSEAEDIPLMQLGDKFRVGNDGLVQLSYDGSPVVYLAGTSSSDFLMVPYNSSGTALIDDQFRFNATWGAWQLGRDNAGGNGKGLILRSDDGTRFLLTASNAGNAVLTELT